MAKHRAKKTDAAVTEAATEATGQRIVVYVHGVCRHEAGYSDPWWSALRPYLGAWPEADRREVLWSDAVHGEEAEAVAVGRPTALQRAVEELTRRGVVSGAAPQAVEPVQPEAEVVSDQIRDVLTDRAAQQQVEATLRTHARPNVTREAVRRPLPMANAAMPEAFLGVPGLNCIDDFGTYLTDGDVRKRVIARFREVVRPLLRQGSRLEVVSHSWGTVVAYEALCQLDEEAALPNDAVHNWFTVGAALAITPVRRRLLPIAAGQKPRLVGTWVNLNARFDIVGGAMQGQYDVDHEFLGLTPVGCSRIFPNPACAHGSYFQAANEAVNRDIFAQYITS